MSLLQSLPIIGKWFDKGLDLADQAIVDKDKLNELIVHLAEGRDLIEKDVYLAALKVETIPWVDALHKMGRQILNMVTIIGIFVILILDIDISAPAAAIIGGPNMVYQYVKKTGK